ncbi:MAG TPA: thiamine phosphate synthase [Polyangiaceae bacterium]|nr:thiamine phosphate synthase [Polyangiaceae bacterium]
MLIAISDLSALSAELLLERLARLARAAKPNHVALLLRDHQASARHRLALGEELRAIAREHEQQLWVADRADLALLLEADVLHLGEASAPANVVRPLLPPQLRISRAWHAPTWSDPALDAELSGVDALLLSPLLAPRKGRPALGLAALGVLGEQLRARHSAYPQIFALGGVSAENAAACLAAGAAGVAAIGAALGPDPAPLLDALAIAR